MAVNWRAQRQNLCPAKVDYAYDGLHTNALVGHSVRVKVTLNFASIFTSGSITCELDFTLI